MERRIRRVASLLLVVLMTTAAAGNARGQTLPESHSSIRIPPGGVVIGDTITYRGGAIVLDLAPSGFDSCSSGYVCLWEYINFTGAMIQVSSCCSWFNLADFGFDNRASSWRNRKSVDAQLATDPSGGGSRLCLNNNSYSGSMPGGWDDVASSIRVRDVSTYC